MIYLTIAFLCTLLFMHLGKVTDSFNSSSDNDPKSNMLLATFSVCMAILWPIFLPVVILAYLSFRDTRGKNK